MLEFFKTKHAVSIHNPRQKVRIMEVCPELLLCGLMCNSLDSWL